MKEMKVVGVVLLVVAAVCLVIAVERYQANANAVNAMNQMSGGLLQAMAGGEALRPSIPVATKYAVLGVVIFGVGGVYCLVKSKAGSAP